MIYLFILGWLLLAVLSCVGWMRDFDELPLFVAIMALLTAPCTFITWYIPSRSTTIYLWKKKK